MLYLIYYYYFFRRIITSYLYVTIEIKIKIREDKVDWSEAQETKTETHDPFPLKSEVLIHLYVGPEIEEGRVENFGGKRDCADALWR